MRSDRVDTIIYMKVYEQSLDGGDDSYGAVCACAVSLLSIIDIHLMIVDVVGLGVATRYCRPRVLSLA